jgi:molecular chaperone IbpA|tara:strand:- start:194 stop:595 length:402 start_codon:yes stop_codon:yes gene_type:complete
MYHERLKDFLNFSVGFDSIFHNLEHLCYNGAPYPHYDVVKSKDENYTLEMALAGYKKDSIKVSVKDNILTVEGGSKDDPNKNYVSKGIAKRYFKKRMQISDHLEVEKAKFEDGMLLISLKNIRESKAKEIKIS